MHKKLAFGLNSILPHVRSISRAEPCVGSQRVSDCMRGEEVVMGMHGATVTFSFRNAINLDRLATSVFAS